MATERELALSRAMAALLAGDPGAEAPKDADVYAWRLIRWEADVPLTDDQRDALLEGVLEREAYIRQRLTGYTVSGRGLMLGIETQEPVGEVIAACREKGVLALSAKTKLRLLPPLNIPMALLAEAIDVIMEALK